MFRLLDEAFKFFLQVAARFNIPYERVVDLDDWGRVRGALIVPYHGESGFSISYGFKRDEVYCVAGVSKTLDFAGSLRAGVCFYVWNALVDTEPNCATYLPGGKGYYLLPFVFDLRASIPVLLGKPLMRLNEPFVAYALFQDYSVLQVYVYSSWNCCERLGELVLERWGNIVISPSTWAAFKELIRKEVIWRAL